MPLLPLVLAALHRPAPPPTPAEEPAPASSQRLRTDEEEVPGLADPPPVWGLGRPALGTADP